LHRGRGSGCATPAVLRPMACDPTVLPSAPPHFYAAVLRARRAVRRFSAGMNTNRRRDRARRFWFVSVKSYSTDRVSSAAPERFARPSLSRYGTGSASSVARYRAFQRVADMLLAVPFFAASAQLDSAEQGDARLLQHQQQQTHSAPSQATDGLHQQRALQRFPRFQPRRPPPTLPPTLPPTAPPPIRCGDDPTFRIWSITQWRYRYCSSFVGYPCGPGSLSARFFGQAGSESIMLACPVACTDVPDPLCPPSLPPLPPALPCDKPPLYLGTSRVRV
jgi:hypothetical protein